MDLKTIDGVIFDLDGTFIDSMSVWHEVDVEFFRRRNMEIPEGYKEIIKKMPFDASAEFTRTEYNIKESAEEIIQEWHDLSIDAYKNHVKLKDGAREFAAKCKEHGIKIGYATASEDSLCETVLMANGVRQYFDEKTYVNEVQKDKSEPDVYLLCAKRLGVKPERCLVCEDILSGLLSAKKAGFITCGMYDDASAKDWEKIKRISDFAIQSFSELM